MHRCDGVMAVIQEQEENCEVNMNEWGERESKSGWVYSVSSTVSELSERVYTTEQSKRTEVVNIFIRCGTSSEGISV